MRSMAVGYLKPIEEVIEVGVEGIEKGDSDEAGKQVLSYNYFSNTLDSVQVKIKFSDPKALSTTLVEPDFLKIVVLNPGVFIDKQTKEPLLQEIASSLKKRTPIPIQYSEAELFDLA